MKVSQWLREYQITGKVPDEKDVPLSFWSGWLMGHSQPQVALVGVLNPRDPNWPEPGAIKERLTMAIRAAEFIEERSK